METASIWTEFKNELLGFIKTRVNNSDIANDILQDVFLKIHLNLDKLKSEDRLTSWVYQITRNSIIDHFRKDKPIEELSDLPLADETDTENERFARCVRPFLRELNESDQDILNETVFGGMSQKEYAELHSLSHSGAKSKTQRARQKLKEVFTNCCAIESDRYGNITDSIKRGCDC